MQRYHSLIFLFSLMYRLSALTWEPISPMLSPRQEFPGVHLNGRIYVAGGMNSNDCCNALKNFEAYDISTNRWKALADIPHGVNHPGIAALEGKIYVIGGYVGKNTPTNTVFAYNPATDEWTEIDMLDRTTANPGVCVYGNKIWVFGGTSVHNKWDRNPNTTVQVYDPSTREWTTVNSDMPEGKCHVGVGIVDGKAYISPGRPPREDVTCREFDFSKAGKGAEAWRRMADMPAGGRTGYVSTWPVVDGKLYYIGGEEKSNALNTIHVFDPRDGDRGTWTSFSPSYPTGLHGVGPVAVDNSIYVMGGGTSVNVGGRTDSCYVMTIGTTPVARKPDTGINGYHAPGPRVVLFPNVADNTAMAYSLTGERIAGKKGRGGVLAPRVVCPER